MPMRIDLAGWTREATRGDPRAFFALFEEADRLGFDGAWFSEFRLPEADWPYPSPLLLAAALLARYVCIGADADAVAAQLDALWPKLYERRVYFAGRRGVPASEVPPIDVDRVLREQFIHGDPAACFEQIAALRGRTGIPNLRCVFNANGLLGNDAALAGMRLFAREVLPALKAIH